MFYTFVKENLSITLRTGQITDSFFISEEEFFYCREDDVSFV